MRANASTAWDYFDACVFVAHRRGPLVHDDFGEFLADVLSQDGLRRVIVRASDGAPRADHRAALQRWYMSNRVRGAVLTDSLLARGGVTALSWFGVTISAFPPLDLDRALDFVEIEIELWPSARQTMGNVIARVDGLRAATG